MQTPDIVHHIDPRQLLPKDYFYSLVKTAAACGLLSEQDIMRLQAALAALLAGQAERKTQGKSSSVSVETAEMLAHSIVFVLGVRLKSYSAPEQAVEALQKEALAALFEEGLLIVRRKMAAARHLQRRIEDNLLQTPNVFYRATAIDGMNGFFKLYRPQFAAHLVHITLDYPTLSGRPPLEGIECIEAYLRDLEVENSFCVLFDSRDVHRLLCGLTHDYRSCPLNLFESVLLSALGLVLCGQSPRRLDLSRADVAQLDRLMHRKSAADIQALLEKAMLALAKQLPLPPRLPGYAARCLPLLAADLAEAAQLHTLHTRFLVPQIETEAPCLTVLHGDRMVDADYKRLVEMLMQTEDSSEKINLIASSVHSADDLIEILSDAELCEDELSQLVDLLPLSAFAVLLHQYPHGDFLERASERRLFGVLQRKKTALTEAERKSLETLAAHFEIS